MMRRLLVCAGSGLWTEPPAMETYRAGEQPVLLFFAEILLCSLLSAAALPRGGKGWLRASDLPHPHPVRVTGLVHPWWRGQSLGLRGISFFWGKYGEFGKIFSSLAEVVLPGPHLDMVLSLPGA